jgi:hypothetical protein
MHLRVRRADPHIRRLSGCQRENAAATIAKRGVHRRGTGSNTRSRARLTTTQQAINLLRPDRRNDLPVNLISGYNVMTPAALVR